MLNKLQRILFRLLKQNFLCVLIFFARKIYNNLLLYLNRLGLKVAKHPKKVILLSFLCTLVCSMGLFYFYEQKDMVKLWIPADNDFAINHLWLKDNFPPKLRYVYLKNLQLSKQIEKIQRIFCVLTFF